MGTGGTRVDPVVGGTAGRGGSSPTGGTAGRGGSRPLGGTAGRGGSRPLGGTAGRGGSSPMGGNTSVLPLCGQLQPGSCEQCLCNACSSQLGACTASSGCALLAACVVQTGCLMMGVGCYSPTTCGTIIELVGGVESPSVALATQVGLCRLTSGCGC
jgi:hypothetical protein